MPSFYEFFAGGGMVREGLGRDWRCLFANDVDAKKAAAYRANWGDGGELCVGDIRTLAAASLPGRPDLMWGSFPCQDLSLAGAGAGLGGARSGMFHPFWGLIEGLAAEGRAPPLVAVENVCGTLTSHGGRDFAAICAAFARSGYRFGALVIDAALFTPQSRPRLFVIGALEDATAWNAAAQRTPSEPFHTPAVQRAVAALPEDVRRRAVWWRLPASPRRNAGLAAMLEPDAAVSWATPAQTERLLALMAPANRAKVDAARLAGERRVGAVYRRTRIENGERRQRAEARFDDLAGCLRTPGGGSSRQTLLVVEGVRVRSRLLSPRETARLMGLPDSYRLPARDTDAYHLTGDGVVAPVVHHLAGRLFTPLLSGEAADRLAA